MLLEEHFVVYDIATGEARWRGKGAPGDAMLQQLPEGLAAIAVPLAAIIGPEVDLTVLRAAACVGVDAAAELVRQRFITPGAGQALTYQSKSTEALAWTANHNAVTPFLTREAATREMTVAAVVAEVLMAAAAWTAIGSAIEAARLGAKKAIAEAANISTMVAAATVDWDGLTP